MKKFIALILACVLTMATAVTVSAHTWPDNPGDWTRKDWEAWDNWWEDHWSDYYYKKWDWNQYNPYYNGNCYNNNNNYRNNTSIPGNGYNNYYNYWSYNYYGGVLDVYQPETEDQAVILAKIMYLYAHGVASQTQQAAVGWAVMNSIDDSGAGVNIGSIAPNFHYDASKPTRDDFGRDLMPLARDVIFRWKAGRAGVQDNGRVLPNGYDYVSSTGNTVSFSTTPGGYGWGFSWRTPYSS